MAVDIVMPQMELAQESGTLLQWLKAEGDFVQKGEPLLQIETDKVTIDVESPASGVLANLTAQAGDKIPVGQVIALVLNEKDLASRPQRPSPPSAETFSRTRSVTPIARRIAEDHNVKLDAVPATSGRIEKQDVLSYLANRSPQNSRPEKLIAASPKARRLAAARGIQLQDIQGGGASDGIVAGDVLRYIEKTALPEPIKVTHSVPRAEYRVVPLSAMRRVIADRVQASYRSAPHISLTVSVDMTEANHLLEHLNEPIMKQTGKPRTITAMIARVLGSTLLQHPRLNAHVQEGEIHEFNSVHLGIAVALDDGLMVPVIRHIERKGLGAIQAELRDLTERVRKRAIQIDEIKGSTFTITNLGMYGIEEFTAILNPPEAGILAIGEIKETPVGFNGQVALRPMMKMTLNADHRAVDGAVAAAFLRQLKLTLEDPYRLID